MTENPWHVDFFLLKFCRSKNFKIDEVKEMFRVYIDYRRENNLDTILQTFKIDPDLAKNVNKYYPRGYCGVDKIGRPVYIEREGFINPGKLWELTDEQTFMQ